MVIHGVQHLVDPPDHLPGWPGDDHSSRIVFIVRGLSRDMIERSLAAFALDAIEAEAI
jgi:G3E family GTPase